MNSKTQVSKTKTRPRETGDGDFKWLQRGDDGTKDSAQMQAKALEPLSPQLSRSSHKVFKEYLTPVASISLKKISARRSRKEANHQAESPTSSSLQSEAHSASPEKQPEGRTSRESIGGSERRAGFDKAKVQGPACISQWEKRESVDRSEGERSPGEKAALAKRLSLNQTRRKRSSYPQVEELGRPKSNELLRRSPSDTPKTDHNFKESFIFDQSLRANTSNIKVYIRFRPGSCTESEARITGAGQSEIPWIFPTEDTVVLLPENAVFTFDRVFPPDVGQQEVYRSVGFETVADVLNGYNGTLFAYGQTGSGKTFTMFGDLMQEEQSGIIPRAIKHICDHIKEAATDSEYTLTCSMVEIYRESLSDLLCKSRGDLRIKESLKSGIYIDGLTKIIVNNEKELFEVLDHGARNRSINYTRLNTVSSRSHTIFMLEIKQTLSDDSEKRGLLNLIDLAGSEKNGKSGAVGETLEEAKKINLSLTCLGKVIQALSTQNREHVPYRESKLTRILQESLGGNFKTSLIVTCSPLACASSETLSSLKFASRTSTIKNRFRVNIKTSPEALQAVIKRLKEELLACKGELSLYRLTPALIMEKDATIVRSFSEIEIGRKDCSQELVDKISLEPGRKTSAEACSSDCESRKKADYMKIEEIAFLKERLKQVQELNQVLLDEKRIIS